MKALQSCKLCPRRCSTDRLSGALGFCRAGADAEVFRYGPHYGEEPPLSGTGGSGTIFFSRCTLSCLYCQNYPWSQQGDGTTYSADGLAGILRELHAAGCHNWNLVSPTPWIPHVQQALAGMREEAIELPVVYNTSGFERRETLVDLEHTVDIYLTDLRYACEVSAHEGSGRADYAPIAREAILEMWRQKGPLQLGADGMATQGTICRLLILPNRADETIANLHWLADNIGPGIAISVMAQYTPAFRAPAMDGWNRRLARAEYERVAGVVADLGFDIGWMQEYEGDAPDELIGFTMEAGSSI
ncbi:MAG: radical SAM protein [Kiritimatiellia bacterium]|nr:radical SAM protein [Kiritimatiellia bacterium]MDP6630534.1 radical SAM protein [Kiritimatiellia bacterium]MDP6811208.1 radical SAM protein [Kiritimatiellia bacterium]MDP7024347.1 radical SAM protein [Kiritimatiellia bacterium]